MQRYAADQIADGFLHGQPRMMPIIPAETRNEDNTGIFGSVEILFFGYSFS